MRHVFITGSTDGLGRAAARALIDEGHQVVLHARSNDRARALADLAPRAAGLAIGDLASAAETRSLADQVNRIGRMDAVIHNAGVYREGARGNTPEGHAKILAVNTLAPYLLTKLLDRPDRLVYLSSGMHRGGEDSLRDIDWKQRRWDANAAYSESKLYITSLAFAVARHWPGVSSNAVDPGWVPTRMGGPGAPDDLEEGHRTQTWLATSDDRRGQ
jgi:NAD(P)-dependent dehydrogenase (short-subunit alcohol dehydrogenase family)